MTTLNDVFTQEPTQEDEGYKSGSESLSIPTPPKRALRIYHVSASKNISLDPATLLFTAEQHPEHLSRRFRSHSHLVFTSSNEKSPVRTCDPQ